MHVPVMKTKKDCGLTALAWAVYNVIGGEYEVIYSDLKKIMEYNDFDLDDNPAEHERVLNEYAKSHPEHELKFGLVEPIKLNVFTGQCPIDRTVILVQFPYDETKYHILKTIMQIIRQHWVVLKSLDMEKQIIELWWGNGTFQKFTFNEFEQWMTCGSPQCVYVVGESKFNKGNPWYSRLYAWIINKICHLIKPKKVTESEISNYDSSKTR